MMDLYLSPKPAIILPAPRGLLKPKFAWLPGIALPFAPTTGAPPASLSFVTNTGSDTDLTTYTFSAVSIGTADSTRRVIVGVSWGSSASGKSISSATIGGVSATIHAQTNTTNGGAGLISALVSTGTTADIVVTMSAGCLNMEIGVHRLVNETSSTPHATQTDNVLSGAVLSVAIDVPSNGVLVGVAQPTSSGAGLTATWAGATEQYDLIREISRSHTGADATGLGSETGRTVSTTFSATPIAAELAVLTWG